MLSQNKKRKSKSDGDIATPRTLYNEIENYGFDVVCNKKPDQLLAAIRNQDLVQLCYNTAPRKFWYWAYRKHLSAVDWWKYIDFWDFWINGDAIAAAMQAHAILYRY